MKSEYIHPNKLKFLKRIGMTEKELERVRTWREKDEKE